MSYIFGQQYHNIAGAYRVEGLGVFGLGLCFLGTEEFKLTSDAGETDTLVDSSSWYINTGYCYEFKKNIFIGANFKYIKEGYYIDDESMTSGGTGLGIGVLTESLLIKDMGLSCVIKNIGFKSDYNDGTEGSMPFEMVLGSKYHIGFASPAMYMKGLFLTSDIAVNNYSRTGIKIGGESVLAGMPMDLQAYIRLGLQLPAPIEGYFTSGLFTGLGIKWQNYGLDYAFNYAGADLGAINYLTLGIDI